VEQPFGWTDASRDIKTATQFDENSAAVGVKALQVASEGGNRCLRRSIRMGNW